MLKYENLDVEFSALVNTQAKTRGLSTAKQVVHPGESNFDPGKVVKLPASDLNATSKALLIIAYRQDFAMLGYSAHDVAELGAYHKMSNGGRAGDVMPNMEGPMDESIAYRQAGQIVAHDLSASERAAREEFEDAMARDDEDDTWGVPLALPESKPLAWPESHP